MRTPIRPLPEHVTRWTHRARWLRWLDAVAAWGAVWLAAVNWLPGEDGGALAVLAALATLLAAAVRPLRWWWRPVTALAAVAASRGLRAGSPAWYLGPDGPELVVVTARRGLRVVIARPPRDAAEGVSVLRTRALLVAAEPFAEPR